jgi:hypothetical protein
MKGASEAARRRLLEAFRRFHAQLEEILRERGPLIRGSFGTRARVCGNPTCHCTRGALHESKYLSASDGGKARQVHIPVQDEEEVAAGVERYRRFRQMRVQLAELAKEQLELAEQLGLKLLKPYPPDDPLPPPRKRGRPPRAGRSHSE